MADAYSRRESWLDYFPGNVQQSINTSPLLNALGRALSKPTPDLTRGIEYDQYGSVSDRNWLLEQARGGPPKMNPLAAEMLDKGGLLANFLGPGVKLPAAAPKPPGIRAYHGSPHDFDKFDMSKIGTGEGAQAYGRGLYFAENEGVARSYRDQLSQKYVKVLGGDADASREMETARALLKQIRGPAKKSPYGDVDLETAAKTAEGWRSFMEQDGINADRVIEILRRGEIKPDPGRMYEVNIKADPDQFLDWDLPLNQQPEGVKRTIEPALKAAALDLGKGASPEKIAQFEAMGLKNVADRMRPKEIDPWSLDTVTLAQQYPNALRDAGIPGIKYLDQGSRAAGQGSRNFVVFDEKLIEILRKYGLLPPVAAGIAAALNQQEPPL